jgi:hypothetical protein
VGARQGLSPELYSISAYAELVPDYSSVH